LPDGLFSDQKSEFGQILEGLAMENLGILYDLLVYFKDIGNMLRPFGIFCGHLVISPCFGNLYQEKSGNPDDNMVFWMTETEKDTFAATIKNNIKKLLPGFDLMTQKDQITEL
jgi:hypothetical protein